MSCFCLCKRQVCRAFSASSILCWQLQIMHCIGRHKVSCCTAHSSLPDMVALLQLPKGFEKKEVPSGKGYIRLTPQPNVTWAIAESTRTIFWPVWSACEAATLLLRTAPLHELFVELSLFIYLHLFVSLGLALPLFAGSPSVLCWDTLLTAILSHSDPVYSLLRLMHLTVSLSCACSSNSKWCPTLFSNRSLFEWDLSCFCTSHVLTMSLLHGQVAWSYI